MGLSHFSNMQRARESNKKRKRSQRDFDSDSEWNGSEESSVEESSVDETSDPERPSKRRKLENDLEEEDESEEDESSGSDLESIDVSTSDGKTDDVARSFKFGKEAFGSYLSAAPKDRARTSFWKHVSETHLALLGNHGHAKNHERCKSMVAADYDFTIVGTSCFKTKCFACNMVRQCTSKVLDKKSGKILGYVGAECLARMEPLQEILVHLRKTTLEYDAKQAELDKFKQEAYDKTMELLENVDENLLRGR